MKKLLLLLVMVSMGVATASAQKYYVPKFKKTKEVRDYEMEPKRKVYLTLGGSFNMGLGFQNHIKYKDHGYDVAYDENMQFDGVSVLLGGGFRVTENFHAGIESGVLIQAGTNAVPLYASLKYYYGPALRQKRTRFFNYLDGGPQFYFTDKSKPVGYMVGAGGGMRLLVKKSVRTDFFVGYQLNVRGVQPHLNGDHTVNPQGVTFNQYAHVIQIGLAIPIL